MSEVRQSMNEKIMESPSRLSMPSSSYATSSIERDTSREVRLADPNIFLTQDEKDKLYYAARDGDVMRLQRVLDKAPPGSKLDTNLIREPGELFTPLHITFSDPKTFQIETAKLLLEYGNADPCIGNRDGDTPLHFAAYYGHLEAVKLFTRQPGVDIDVQSEIGWTPLHSAASQGHDDVVLYLVRKNLADVERKNAATDEGGKETPLFLAVRSGHVSTVRTLITKCGANPRAVNGEGDSLLHVAVYNGHDDILTMLIDEFHLDFNAKNEEGESLLHVGVKEGQGDIIILLVAKYNMDLGVRAGQGATLLHYAAMYGQAEIAERLLEQKACLPDEEDYEGDTALIYAAEQGHANIVKTLIHTYKQDPNTIGKGGTTPLNAAVDKGKTTMVKKLLQKYGADPNIADSDGDMPFHTAARKGAVRICELLLRAGAETDRVNNDGKTPLDELKSVKDKDRKDQIRELIFSRRRLIENHTSGNSAKISSKVTPDKHGENSKPVTQTMSSTSNKKSNENSDDEVMIIEDESTTSTQGHSVTSKTEKKAMKPAAQKPWKSDPAGRQKMETNTEKMRSPDGKRSREEYPAPVENLNKKKFKFVTDRDDDRDDEQNMSSIKSNLSEQSKHVPSSEQRRNYGNQDGGGSLSAQTTNQSVINESPAKSAPLSATNGLSTDQDPTALKHAQASHKTTTETAKQYGWNKPRSSSCKKSTVRNEQSKESSNGAETAKLQRKFPAEFQKRQKLMRIFQQHSSEKTQSIQTELGKKIEKLIASGRNAEESNVLACAVIFDKLKAAQSSNQDGSKTKPVESKKSKQLGNTRIETTGNQSGGQEDERPLPTLRYDVGSIENTVNSHMNSVNKDEGVHALIKDTEEKLPAHIKTSIKLVRQRLEELMKTTKVVEFGAPRYFLCPLTKMVMADPVVAEDGYSYERASILNRIASGHDSSCMTGQSLSNTRLYPNNMLRVQILEWAQSLLNRIKQGQRI